MSPLPGAHSKASDSTRTLTPARRGERPLLPHLGLLYFITVSSLLKADTGGKLCQQPCFEMSVVFARIRVTSSFFSSPHLVFLQVRKIALNVTQAAGSVLTNQRNVLSVKKDSGKTLPSNLKNGKGFMLIFVFVAYQVWATLS